MSEGWDDRTREMGRGEGPGRVRRTPVVNAGKLWSGGVATAVVAALIALVGYLLLSIHAFISVRVLGELKLSYLNAGPTELRLVLITMTLAMIAAGSQNALLGMFTWFDVFVGAVGCLLILLFILQTWTTARRLAVDEPPVKWPR